MKILIALICGFIFGLGLIIGQMSNPAKVLNFLDFAGHWDPSLAFVMIGAVAVAAVGFALGRRRIASVLGGKFHVPAATRIDAPLVLGAALFGIGWGLIGFCPGPAITALGFGSIQAVIFVAAMIVGMLLFQLIETSALKKG
jgi:uncharacterized protein